MYLYIISIHVHHICISIYALYIYIYKYIHYFRSPCPWLNARSSGGEAVEGKQAKSLILHGAAARRAVIKDGHVIDGKLMKTCGKITEMVG